MIMLRITPFKNQLLSEAKNENMTLVIMLNTVKNNKRNIGCQGHIFNTQNLSCVYVNTTSCEEGTVIYRYAKNEHDFSETEENHYCSETNAAKTIINFLKQTKDER